MQEDNEVQKTIMDWSKLDEQEISKYFRPVLDQKYKITIAKAGLYMKQYKDEQPRLNVSCELATIDGVKTTQLWETGAWNVMREIRGHVKNNTLVGSVFLVKQYMENGRKKYTFETLEVGGKATTSKNNSEAFV